jgi:glycosyltransferase involved in cell wall biosynthesis
MTLSVIIVNYNVRQFLDNALSSVHRALSRNWRTL